MEHRAWLAWIHAWGPAGAPAPLVANPTLIGGPRNGERYLIPVNERAVQVPDPMPPLSLFAEPGPIPEVAMWTTTVYTRRTFVPCWAAQPVAFFVASGLSDDHARALAMEHVFVGDMLPA